MSKNELALKPSLRHIAYFREFVTVSKNELTGHLIGIMFYVAISDCFPSTTLEFLTCLFQGKLASLLRLKTITVWIHYRLDASRYFLLISDHHHHVLVLRLQILNVIYYK